MISNCRQRHMMPDVEYAWWKSAVESESSLLFSTIEIQLLAMLTGK